MKQQICQNPKCGQTFTPTSGHARKYCARRCLKAVERTVQKAKEKAARAEIKAASRGVSCEEMRAREAGGQRWCGGCLEWKAAVEMANSSRCKVCRNNAERPRKQRQRAEARSLVKAESEKRAAKAKELYERGAASQMHNSPLPLPPWMGRF